MILFLFIEVTLGSSIKIVQKPFQKGQHGTIKVMSFFSSSRLYCVSL